MPNAPIAPDVDLDRLAHAAKCGWTFRVNKAGLWVKGPDYTDGYHGRHEVTTDVLDMSAVPRPPSYTLSVNEQQTMALIGERGPQTVDQVFWHLYPNVKNHKSYLGGKLRLLVFRMLELLVADGRLVRRFEGEEFVFEAMEAEEVKREEATHA